MFQLLKDFWQKSWTKTLAGIQSVAGCLLLLSADLNQFLTNPELRAAVDKLSPPPWVSTMIVAIAVITYIASEHAPKPAVSPNGA